MKMITIIQSVKGMKEVLHLLYEPEVSYYKIRITRNSISGM
jgi:hypothetical protein